MQNQAVVAGQTNATFTCSSPIGIPEDISWYTWPVLGSRGIALGRSSHLRIPADYDILIDGKKNQLIVKIASVSRAGVYYCISEETHFAQLIVVSKCLHVCPIGPTTLYCILRSLSERVSTRRSAEFWSAVREAVLKNSYSFNFSRKCRPIMLFI